MKEYADIEKSKQLIKGDINEICSNEHLNTLEGMAACKKACAPHVCCWDEDDACYGEVRGCCYFVSILRLMFKTLLSLIFWQ